MIGDRLRLLLGCVLLCLVAPGALAADIAGGQPQTT
jgi:hypothetical protein